jgi:hypothetical protein
MMLDWTASSTAIFKKQASDLVVNVGSMTRIDGQAGGFIDDSYEFGTNPFVYHCNYFLRPELASSLTRWLTLPDDSESAGRGGLVVRPPLSFRTSRSFIELDARTPTRAARIALREAEPDFVIVRRGNPRDGRTPLRLPQRRDVAPDETEPGATPSKKTLDLFRSDPFPEVGPTEWTPPDVVDIGRTRDRTARRRRPRRPPVGVLPENPPVLPLPDAARRSRRASKPPSRPAKARQQRTATPHVYAEMPPQIKVREKGTVRVLISPQAIAAATTATAQQSPLGDAFDPSEASDRAGAGAGQTSKSLVKTA